MGKILKKYWTAHIFIAIFSTLSMPITQLCAESMADSNIVSESDKSLGKSDWMQIDDVELLRDALKVTEKELLSLKRDQLIQQKKYDNMIKKFIELSSRYRQQSLELRKIQLGVAGAVTREGIEYVGDWEDRLKKVLREFSGRTYKLAKDTVVLCDKVIFIASRKDSDKEMQQLKEQADAVRSDAQQFMMYKDKVRPGENPREAGSIKVVDVNRELGLVVLSSGSSEGIRIGMKLYMNLKNRKVPLHIVAVRPQVSAGGVADGDVKNIAVGMRVNSIKRTQK